jgi:hypothetical protein
MSPKRNRTTGTERQAETYNKALHTLARMRRTGTNLTAAAREEGIDPRTVKRLLGPEITKAARPTKADRRLRDMLIPTSGGTSPVVVRGSAQASLLGKYMAVVGNYLRSGDSEGLEEFEGKSIGGHRLITDPDALDSLAQAGSLQLDEIYALPESSS